MCPAVLMMSSSSTTTKHVTPPAGKNVAYYQYGKEESKGTKGNSQSCFPVFATAKYPSQKKQPSAAEHKCPFEHCCCISCGGIYHTTSNQK
mmetsp:Transcript_15533/g.27450  ORF Transcript_15533/g.27450 Transcript_15533/m.27450 type:complete len:91 (+) Transcript_15533:674-946(+)